MNGSNDKITIYYDSTCRMCSGIVDKLGHSSQKTRFDPLDIHRVQLPKGIASANAERDVHAIDGNGNVYSGMDAVTRIIEEYPRWRWSSKILRLPGIRQIAALAYRIIADNRHKF